MNYYQKLRVYPILLLNDMKVYCFEELPIQFLCIYHSLPRYNEYQKDSDRQHVKPTKGFCNPCQCTVEGVAGKFGVADSSDHQKQNNDDGGEKYRKKNGGVVYLAFHSKSLFTDRKVETLCNANKLYIFYL